MADKQKRKNYSGIGLHMPMVAWTTSPLYALDIEQDGVMSERDEETMKPRRAAQHDSNTVRLPKGGNGGMSTCIKTFVDPLILSQVVSPIHDLDCRSKSDLPRQFGWALRRDVPKAVGGLDC